MTEEELEKKAEERIPYPICTYDTKCKNWHFGFVNGAKFMQEENDRLSQHILELQKDKGRLTDENNRLLDVINNQDVKIADLEEICKDTRYSTPRSST